jgi:hypothetical protein
MSIDKQLEFSGERRNMSYEHSAHLKDRDGSDIYEETQKLKKALIHNANYSNENAYSLRDRFILPPSPQPDQMFHKVAPYKISKRFEHVIPDNFSTEETLNRHGLIIKKSDSFLPPIAAHKSISNHQVGQMYSNQ